MENISDSIKSTISQMKAGQLFSIKDFTDITSYETAKKTLQRMEKEGSIVRVVDGLYSKPKISKLLNKPVPVSVSDVAEKLAEKFSWHIVPSGNTALNQLHLSTQVPACYEYLSDGPYREYEIYGMKLNFKHTCNSMISEMSTKTALVIQALKKLGQENITYDIIQTLKQNLLQEEKAALIKESVNVPVWIKEYVQIIGSES
ncbi:MAG: hypothetical protein HUK25_03925 [Treponema sp.]|nr:hypothetical protein [Treponema sp.]